MDVLRQAILDSVISILPHKSEDEADKIVDYVIKEGVKKIADLRRMTIDNLKNVCDTVDSSDLFEEWQKQYGVRDNNPTREREPLRQVNTQDLASAAADTVSYTIPVFDKDSPFIPSTVRRAIEKKQRPSPADRKSMVERIVDHVSDKIPHFRRADFNTVADQIVSSYPESFKDSFLTNNNKIGSDSLRRQLVIRYDNKNRNQDVQASSSKQRSSNPEAYGCLNWNPPLPENDTVANQVKVKESLKKMMENTVRHWEWRKVKSSMEASFFLQRENINGPTDEPPPNKRPRSTEDSDVSSAESAMTVPELLIEWPCLFKPNGMNHHFLLLTGVDFFEKLDKFMADEGKFLIDYVASKGKDQSRVRVEMSMYERRGSADASLVALIKLLMMYFREDSGALFTFVEETTDLEEVDLSKLPADKTPHLVIAGPHLHEISKVYVAIDGVLVNTSETFREAFTLVFCSYFVLNIKYSEALPSTLSYIQKAIAGIAPEKGTKCVNAAEQRKVNRKVTKLANEFKPFYDSFKDQNTQP